jgi:uncharacterized RDD family membrane protein YckC
MNEKSPEKASRTTAGFFSRTVAFLLDLFLLAFLELMSGVVFFLILQFFHYQNILNFMASLLGVNNSAIQLAGLISPILFLLSVVYFVFFWTLIGSTPGKALLGLQVVRQDGRSLSVGRSLVRFFAYSISAVLFFLGFIWILFDRQHEGWHDKIANTHVIYRNIEK